jgi:asparagine synthase (glutamine-hydrolysing)
MCGIFASNDPLVSFEHNKILDEHLKFRGPDFQSNIIKHKNWFIYHARLAVIGLSEKYNQPYECSDGSTLLFNGEIFNYKELSLKKLNIKNAVSDTDILSKLIIKKNFDYNWLDGFFALIRISKNGKLLNCARDPFGVKPLFYYKRKNFITICSEPIVIKKIFKLKINKKAFKEYFLFRAPLFSESYFKKINTVKPGNCLTEGNHFDLLKEFLKKKKNKKNLDIILKRSIKLRMRSDAKIGLLLSGGIDSNLIRYNIPRVDYFSGGFTDDFDYKYLKKNNIKVNFTKVTKSNFLKRLRKLIYLRGEPLSVPNEVVLSLIAKNAKRKKIKVLMSGDGADEFFGGYDRVFDWSLKNRFTVEKFCDFYCYNKINKDSLEFLNLKKFFNKLKKLSCFEKVKFFFIKFHLPILLRRLDFSLMSEGIEGREPFLSKEVFIESMKYNKNELMRDKLGKRPLRTISKKYFGQKFASLKKVGFPIDMSRIIKYKNGRISNYNLWFRLNQKILMELK